MSATGLVEHFFRHEYGRLVSLLACRVGVRRIADVEDAVQQALLTALECWMGDRIPASPSGWLYRVARNHLLDTLRTGARREELLAEHGATTSPAGTGWAERLPDEFEEFGDSLLRMLFVCADQSIPRESQLVLALKTLGGFSVAELAPRLFTAEENIYKRLQRARQKLREQTIAPDALTEADFAARLPMVQRMLYLIFTEGHLSVRQDATLRRDLCAEAIRLADLLVHHPAGDHPSTKALLALFHLTAARLEAREGGASGGLLLLEEQDRSRWNPEQLERGLRWLQESAAGEQLSRYHVEAGIAAEHAMAPDFAATRWDRIARSYEQLDTLAPSPLHTLNRALAVAEWQGAEAGLAVLKTLEAPSWLIDNHLWAAVHADLHRRCGHAGEAKRFTELALRTAPNDAIRTMLQRRLTQA